MQIERVVFLFSEPLTVHIRDIYILVQHKKAATFLHILKSFFRPEKSFSVCEEMLPLFRAVLKFCSTNRLFTYIYLL